MPTRNPVTLDKTQRIIADRLSSIAAALWKERDKSIPRQAVNFYDYDGSIVHSFSVYEFTHLDEMPGCPAHEGLTAQGWNWTIAAAKEYVSKYGYLDIGVSYITEDGNTRLYIDIAETERLTVKINFTQSVANGVIVNWGDDSQETSEATGAVAMTHTYAAAGRYIITLTPVDGCNIMLGSDTTAGSALNSVSTNYTKGLISGQYVGGREPLIALEIGSGVIALGSGALKFCNRLRTITIPRSVIAIPAWALEGCGMLQACILPYGLTSIGYYAMRCNYNMKHVSMPETLSSVLDGAFATCCTLQRAMVPEGIAAITAQMFVRCFSADQIIVPDSVQDIGAQAFESCYSLRAVNIPEGTEIIKTRAFRQCYNLTDVKLPSTLKRIAASAFTAVFGIRSLVIPASVTQIDEFAFLFCDGNEEIHVLATTPPVLTSATAFQAGRPDIKIYVPYSEDHSILAAYLEATNWCSVEGLTEEPAPVEAAEEEGTT